MGSLMAGWDSPVLKSKSDIYKRNRSLTKQDIEAYWKSNKKREEQQQHSIGGDAGNSEVKTATVNQSDKTFQKSSTMPVARNISKEQQGRKYFMDGETETMASSAHKLADNSGWWTRSNWAFLNEPPKEGAPDTTKRYASQFHVTRSATGGADGIST